MLLPGRFNMSRMRPTGDRPTREQSEIPKKRKVIIVCMYVICN